MSGVERVLDRLTALDEAAAHLLDARQWVGNMVRRMALDKPEHRIDDAAATAEQYVRRCREALAVAAYRGNATCPKCLGGDVSVVWCPNCHRFRKPDHHEERMHRTCRRCGYAWDELPATTPAEEK